MTSVSTDMRSKAAITVGEAPLLCFTLTGEEHGEETGAIRAPKTCGGVGAFEASVGSERGSGALNELLSSYVGEQADAQCGLWGYDSSG